MAQPIESHYIQLTKLPNLKEIDHDSKDTSIDRILAKAIALQLKTLNADITKFAFDHLLMLIDEQLDSMISQLHKISNIQRRESVAKCDLQLFMKGFNLSPSDLDLQGQLSQYTCAKFQQEYLHLHSLKETYMKVVEDDNEQIENVLTTLVPPTNSLKLSIPRWLPALPPDHTYKFTPQFNHPITDEVIIRKKVVEEGKQSELALLHLSEDSSKNFHYQLIPDFDQTLAREETLAIYGSSKHKKKQNSRSSESSLISKLPQANFSVQEYARIRVEIARRKVLEFEEKTMQSERNPFIKGSKLMLAIPNEKMGKRQVNKEIRTMLKRSFYSMIKSIPELQEQKNKARKDAEEKRNERLEEMKILQEKKQQEQNEKVRSGEIDLLDLEHQDELFGSLDSSDEEAQSQLPQDALISQSVPDSEPLGEVSNSIVGLGAHHRPTLPQDHHSTENAVPRLVEQDETKEHLQRREQGKAIEEARQHVDVDRGDSDNGDSGSLLFEDVTDFNTASVDNADEIEL